MSNQPSGPQTPWTQMMTQAIHNVRQRVSPVALKKGARVPQISIQEEKGKKPVIYQLLGDRYLIGRSSRACDIVIQNEVVSSVHCSLERDSQDPQHFVIKDENSTNGIYLGRNRLKEAFRLKHGDSIVLGPPEAKASVTLNYDNPPPVWLKAITYSLYGTAGLLGIFACWLVWEWRKYDIYPLPMTKNGPVVVYAGDGKTTLRTNQKITHQEIGKLSDFSPHLRNALIASEDRRFYWHFGVDPYGLVRAIFVNSGEKGLRQGASTITQQLARSLFPEVGRENTANRKIREMVVASKLEAAYSKNEILRTYLNRVYLGEGLYGFEDAAQFYFEKSARNLKPEEAATLVAMLPAPNAYNPVADYNTTVQLRNRVLSNMVDQGMLTPLEETRARRSRIQISRKAQKALSKTIAPYYYSYVLQELKGLLGQETAREGNYIIETSLDINLQQKAESILKKTVTSQGSSYGFSQGGLVTLNSKNGEVLALVGGVDYTKSQFNRATQSKRQPGSTFKLFAYLAALKQGISPYKVYSCGSFFWQGQQFKPCERLSGSTDMYGGIAQSENAIALRVAEDVGLSNVVNMAQSLGITSPLNAVPGLVLGQSEVSVLEMTGAYAAVANQGFWHRPHAIKRILDAGDCKKSNQPSTCRLIYLAQDDPTAHQQAISANVAQTMTGLLQGAVDHGTGRAASIGLGEAGKTGTTNNGVDLWFIGYIPSRDRATGIWLGNDNNKPTDGSSAQAAALWARYMQ